MKPRTLIVLIIALAAVAAYFFLVEERERLRSIEADLSMRRLLPYGPRDVDRILLRNPYGDAIEMIRDGERWLITRPVEDTGDTPAIEMFLHLIVPGQILAEYRDAGDPAAYGLDSPLASVVLESDRYVRSDTIHVGDKSQTTDRAYVRLGGSRSVIVTRELTQNVMRKKLLHLRDKRLMHLDQSEITSLALISPDSRLDISRSESEWIIGASALRADRVLIEPYLTSLSAAIIYEFAAEHTADSARFGIGDPSRELLLRTDSSEPIRISFGRRENHFVPVLRTGRDKIVMIEADFLKAFSWVQDHAIMMNLTLASPGDVAAMRWEWPDSSVSFERVDEGWRMTGTAGSPAETGAPDHLLLVLSASLFESLADDPVESGAAFDPNDTLRIELRGEAGEILDVIRMARLPGGRVFASSLSADAAGFIYPVSLFELERAFDASGR